VLTYFLPNIQGLSQNALYNVGLHEAGHVLGLDHNNQTIASIMYPTSLNGTCYSTYGQSPANIDTSALETYYDPKLRAPDAPTPCPGGVHNPICDPAIAKRKAFERRQLDYNSLTRAQQYGYLRSLRWIHGPDTDGQLTASTGNLFLASSLVVEGTVVRKVASVRNAFGQASAEIYRVKTRQILKSTLGVDHVAEAGQFVNVEVPDARLDIPFSDDPQLVAGSTYVLLLTHSMNPRLTPLGEIYKPTISRLSKWFVSSNGTMTVLGPVRTLVAADVNGHNALDLYRIALSRYRGAALVNSSDQATAMLLSANHVRFSDYEIAIRKGPAAVLQLLHNHAL
jgi:hypothetical protein